MTPASQRNSVMSEIIDKRKDSDITSQQHVLQITENDDYSQSEEDIQKTIFKPTVKQRPFIAKKYSNQDLLDELNSKKNHDEVEFNEIQEMLKSMTVNKKASMPDGLYLQKKQIRKGMEPPTKLFKKLTSKGDLHLDTRNSPLGSG